MGFWDKQLRKNAETKTDEELRQEANDTSATYDNRRAAREVLKERDKK